VHDKAGDRESYQDLTDLQDRFKSLTIELGELRERKNKQNQDII
jgi:hypothetical protein